MSSATKRRVKLAGLAWALFVLAAQPTWAAEPANTVVVPENGYATGASYGTGWKCSYGYEEQNDACVAVDLPANAYLSGRGNSWKCERGYRRDNDKCQKIDVPANGYIKASSQNGWACERGYQPSRDRCELIRIPANAYATNSCLLYTSDAADD